MIVQRKRLIHVFYMLISLAYRVDSDNYVPNEGLDDDWFILCQQSQNEPCEYPSESPSKQPTPFRESREISQSLSPSEIPSPSPCHATNSGFYGDETISNLQSEYIKFDYQMEYGSNGNIDKILKDLERDIMTLILNNTPIFPECVSGTRKRPLFRGSLVFKRGQEPNAVGMSSNPVDVVTSEECPFERLFQDSICVVVGGVLTLFYVENNSSQVQDHKSNIKSAIRVGMSNGSLSMSNSQIIHLEYIGSYRDEGDGSIDTANGKTSSAWNFLSATFVFLVPAGLIVIICLVVVMKRINRQTKMTTLRDPELDNSSYIASEPASITDDDSTNFISSHGNSEKTLFRIWRQP